MILILLRIAILSRAQFADGNAAYPRRLASAGVWAHMESYHPGQALDILKRYIRLWTSWWYRHVCTCSWIHEHASVSSANLGTIISHLFISLYYMNYDTIIFDYGTILSLIFLQISRLLFFIISFLSPKGLLFHLWPFIISLILSAQIIAIIAIITLLFALFLHQTIIPIVFFDDCCYTYFCTYILFQLLLLSHFYLHYFYIRLLLLLSFS